MRFLRAKAAFFVPTEGRTDGRHNTLWRHTHVTCGQEEEEYDSEMRSSSPLYLSLALDSWGKNEMRRRRLTN